MVHPYSHLGVYLFLHVPLLSLPVLTKSGQELYQIFLLFYFENNVFWIKVLLQVRSAGPTPWLIAASVVPGEFLERPTDG